VRVDAPHSPHRPVSVQGILVLNQNPVVSENSNTAKWLRYVGWISARQPIAAVGGGLKCQAFGLGTAQTLGGRWRALLKVGRAGRRCRRATGNGTTPQQASIDKPPRIWFRRPTVAIPAMCRQAVALRRGQAWPQAIAAGDVQEA
jgi:hypothetical protein